MLKKGEIVLRIANYTVSNSEATRPGEMFRATEDNNYGRAPYGTSGGYSIPRGLWRRATPEEIGRFNAGATHINDLVDGFSIWF